MATIHRDRHVHDLKACAAQIRLRRQGLANSMDRARAAALAALDDGMSEVAVAQTLGVNRLTVRKWRGK